MKKEYNIQINDEVIVKDPITKKEIKCRVIDISKCTEECLIVLSEGKAIWKKFFDVKPIPHQ